MRRCLEQQEAYSEAMMTMAQKLGYLHDPIKAITSDVTVDDPTFVIHYTNGDRFATTYRWLKSETSRCTS